MIVTNRGKRFSQPQGRSVLLPEYFSDSALCFNLRDSCAQGNLAEANPTFELATQSNGIRHSKGGRGCYATDTSRAYLGSLNSPIITSTGDGLGDFTIVGTLYAKASASRGMFFNVRYNASGFFGIVLFLNATSTQGSSTATNESGTFFCATLSSAHGFRFVQKTGAIPTSGKQITFAYSRKGTIFSLYLNGLLVDQYNSPVQTSITGPSTQLVSIGGYSAGTGFAVSTPIQMLYAANKAFPDTELRSLSRNCWQIFKPPAEPLIFYSIAGGAITGSFSAAEAGADTFSAAGDVVVSGALSVAETGTDTFAATGDVVVSGALSASEIGGDTFSATGADTATGSLDATETGTDTFAAIGDVVVSGALSVAETGTDTFAATGDVVVSGTLSVAETGTDTFFAAGDVVVSGTLSVAETGTDTFFAAGGNVSTGTLTATETGEDTITANGSVLVEGALAATEGTDSFSASGNVVINGTLAASETGSDTFSASGGAVVAGTLAATETESDTFAASGTQVSTGTLAVTEGTDTFSATGSSVIAGTFAATESTDTFSATGNVIVDGALAVSETVTDTFLAYDPGTTPTAAVADIQWSIIVKRYDFRIIAKEHRKDILIK